jgi:hypothetical protein
MASGGTSLSLEGTVPDLPKLDKERFRVFVLFLSSLGVRESAAC